MDNEELWITANILFQCQEKCYFLICKIWHFSMSLWYPIVLEASPFSILSICASLNCVLFFIGTVLNRASYELVDCPHRLLSLKNEITAYIVVFKKIKVLKLDSLISALFNHSLIFVLP